jgi:recombination protein RecT
VGSEVEVSQRQEVTRFIGSYRNNLARVTPKHVDADTFIGLAAAYVGRSPQLVRAAQQNPASLVMALRECASLGHVVGKDSYVLVPFNNRRAQGGVEVVGVEVYKGVIERMFRAGAVQSVHAVIVRAKDEFELARGPVLPLHRWDPDASVADRGSLRGVYAWAVLASGANSDVVWLNRHDILKYRAVSRSGDAFWGPAWPDEGPWTPDMWRKTALHRLEPLVPTSAAYRWELAQANAAGTGWQGVPDRPVQPGVADVQDAEVVDEPAPNGGADWQDVETRKPADSGGTPAGS